MSFTKRLGAGCMSAMVLGCASGAPTEPEWRVDAMNETAVSRPAGGRCGTTFEFLPPADGQAPNVQRIRIALDCNLRHLGRTSGVMVQTITFTGPTTNLLSATTVYTAANGDELHAVFAGTGALDQGVVTFSGTESYVGGTGRFDGATGSASLSGSASLATLSGFYQTTGSVTY